MKRIQDMEKIRDQKKKPVPILSLSNAKGWGPQSKSFEDKTLIILSGDEEDPIS